MPSLINLISVAAGGAIGASARYGVSIFFGSPGRFPWPTLTANVIGCFIAGIIGTWLLMRLPASTHVQLFLVTGILGGFTTFSAFSLDTLRLAESGAWSLAGLNVLANMLGSLLAACSGWWLARAVLT